jgi:hypothetical protein
MGEPHVGRQDSPRIASVFDQGCRKQPARVSPYRKADYLEPYESALKTVPAELKALGELTADNATQRSRLAELDAVVREKLAELRDTIELRRAGNATAALSVVLSGRGKNRDGPHPPACTGARR